MASRLIRLTPDVWVQPEAIVSMQTYEDRLYIWMADKRIIDLRPDNLEATIDLINMALESGF